MSKTLLLLPIGCRDADVLHTIEEAVASTFPKLTCRTGLDSPQLLEGAFNRVRRQHSASMLLEKLGREFRSGVDYILGVAEVDLYVPDLNFVFGLADVSGGVAVISLHRLKPSFYGEAFSWDMYVERAVKEAVHEMGHIFGLPHCGDSRCVMHFSNSIVDTDRKGRGFCPSCRASLRYS